MGPLNYDAGRGWINSHKGSYRIYMGASSVEVEYSALLCNHNYSLCVIYLLYLSLSCILAYSYNPVCSLNVLGEEEPHRYLNDFKRIICIFIHILNETQRWKSTMDE